MRLAELDHSQMICLFQNHIGNEKDVRERFQYVPTGLNLPILKFKVI